MGTAKATMLAPDDCFCPPPDDNFSREMPPHLKLEYDFFKEAYEREDTRLESLRTRATWICGQLTVLGGALYYLAWNYQSVEVYLVDQGFWLLWVVAGMRFLAALWKIVLTIRVKFWSADFGGSDPLYQFARKLEARNARVSALAKVDIEEHLMRDFTRKFAICAEQNYRNNHERAKRLNAATQAASDVLVLLAICGLFFLYSEARKTPEAIRVKITCISAAYHSHQVLPS